MTFDIDANGILNVSAKDKDTGRQQSVTIANERGRLSKEEIEKMVADAERFKREDEEIQKRKDAKNEYENYCVNMKNQFHEGPLKEFFTNKDKTALEDLAEEGLAWMDNHLDATIEEIDAQKKVLDGKEQVILEKVKAEEKASKGL